MSFKRLMCLQYSTFEPIEVFLKLFQVNCAYRLLKVHGRNFSFIDTALNVLSVLFKAFYLTIML